MRFKHSLAFLLLAGASLLVSGCMQATSPATGRTFSTPISEAQENKIGAEEHPKILAEFGGAYSEKPALNTYIDSVGQFVAATSERQDVKYTFTVLNTADINAFALPGGYIYITRGLLGLAVNEAEVAGVLGHEVGHVTARHTAERMGQQQKAQLGVLAGVLLGSILGGEQGGQLGGQLATEGAQTYLGHYSQDQEFEADTLGVRYLKRATYDPQAMASFLSALNADTHLQARLAGNEAAADAYSMKQSHPRTADRVQQAINAAGPATPGAMLARNEFLTKIDGILWGEDPNDGVVKGREFIHPGLRFTFTAPPGFKLQNQPSQVVGQGKNAAMIFDMGPKNVGDLAAYVQSQWNPKAKVTDVQRIDINGMEGATGIAQGSVNNQPAMFRLVAVRFPDNRVYRFLFMASTNGFQSMDSVFGAAANSFRQLATNEATGYKPMRIRVVEVKAGDTIDSLAARMAVPEAKVDWFKILNRLDQGQPLQAGQLVKIVSY
ncbi:M48 family metalloprotease [Dongia sp.]|uniref:M48 family metalloprotease n=1 Tax=Dongia sp. TaxID=1977262 RepID=UPI0035B3822A